ncbi:uncharacterized protein RCO7_10424 [Rhynchosporium graminicola]|uniref:Zn(2)-C6 fungal-type domain-containing protein n=1 Tax=Rhynchosporium graminicola TaxID=2792576 RepID=A0A1E1L1V3_9HELO|nr:uncharacterized protein RCO7_10424 [Rhynchosporium commune]
MNTSSGTKGAVIPPNGTEDALSMFFDFGEPTQDTLEVLHRDLARQSQERHQRGGIRVSLACVPCRSRHVKCGAEMPNCSRCLQDDKPCFYAKSRRGMRDRNAPKKRASLREAGKTSPGPASSNGNINSLSNLQANSTSEPYTGPSSDGSVSPERWASRMSTKPANPIRLIDLYYSSFHNAHPFLLPRYYFQSRLQSDPESLRFLCPVMQWIASVYSPDVSSAELRDNAMTQIELANLPPNGFTVQALLLAAIATHSQNDMAKSRAILDRAIYLALEIRMNSRTFANMERDPVMAESWRRTYWFLYITDAKFAAFRNATHFMLYSIEANVELPCEECDYDGIIPRSRTIKEYESRDFEDEEPVFSSFTYLIDLTRITGSLLGFDRQPPSEIENAVNNADARLMNWRLHLPREKQGVVDKNEEIDEILFFAHHHLQVILVYIHRPLSRLVQSPLEDLFTCSFPAAPFQQPTGDEDHTYWLHTKKTIEAAEAATNLYALPCPILSHSPLGTCGLTLSTLAQLSACAYILTGPEWYRTRDRIRLGLGGLKAFAEVWPIARTNEKETKMVARSVFAMPRPGTGTTTVTVSVEQAKSVTPNFTYTSAFPVGTPIPALSMVTQNQNQNQKSRDGWQELSEIDYFATWNAFSGRQQDFSGILT